jgi:hypothetical protein
MALTAFVFAYRRYFFRRDFRLNAAQPHPFVTGRAIRRMRIGDLLRARNMLLLLETHSLARYKGASRGLHRQI